MRGPFPIAVCSLDSEGEKEEMKVVTKKSCGHGN